MAERKVLNKYYPPDFDPSKIPRMKLPKNRQYTVRLMAPFNMRCATCGEYIYKGKKFNARKEDVENSDYLGIRIYRFYIKCTRCLQEISFKTDPRNTDYEIEAGATRNFMALKLAEELAQREEEELKEEEASNPMKLLENRTKQSKNEIELLESLEELKDLNKRQQTVDYDTMLSVYDTKLSEREREEKLQQLDEDYIKTVKFQSGTKRKVVEEEIVEENSGSDDDNNVVGKHAKIVDDIAIASSSSSSSNIASSVPPVSKPVKKVENSWNRSIGSIGGKKGLAGLVKRKTVNKQSDDNKDVTSSDIATAENVVSSSSATITAEQPREAVSSSSNNSLAVNGLSLLGAYSDSDESEENQ